jgi:hypothetical protein
MHRSLPDSLLAIGPVPSTFQPYTYATSLVNAGMSLQELMSLLGHSSPEVTIRYAQLASPTLSAAYDQANGAAPHPTLQLVTVAGPENQPR